MIFLYFACLLFFNSFLSFFYLILEKQEKYIEILFTFLLIMFYTDVLVFRAPLALESIDLIYFLSANPRSILKIVKQWIELVQNDTDTSHDAEGLEAGNESKKEISIQRLSKIFLIVGECVMKELIAIDDTVESVVKGDNKAAPRKSTASRRKSTGRKSTHLIERELGTEQGVREQAASQLQQRAESEIVDGVAGWAARAAVEVCKNTNGNINSSVLRVFAALMLCKMMVANQKFCEAQLPLLHHLLKTAPEVQLKCNIVITIGDLFFKYPQVVSGETATLYECLRDPNRCIKKQAVLVLSHLILNDMIKVKGQISDLVLMLEDKDQVLSDLVHAFFSELALKGSSLYNLLPDCISTLSGKDIEQEKFENIMGFLFSFLQKDRQFESLLDKLCSRLKASLGFKLFLLFYIFRNNVIIYLLCS